MLDPFSIPAMAAGLTGALAERLAAAHPARLPPDASYQLTAQRLGQLVPVVEGLPPLQTYADPAIVASTASSGRPGEVSTARSANGVALVAVGGVVALIVLIAILLVVIL